MLKKLVNILKRNSQSKVYYTSLKEIPILKYWKVTEENDIKSMIIDPKNIGLVSELELHKAFYKILQEYYDYFGMNQNYKEYLLSKLNYAKKVCDHNIQQNGISEMYMNIAKVEMEELKPPTKKETIKLWKFISDIEENTPISIDEEKTSAYKVFSRYHSILEKIKHQNKK